MKRFLTLLAVHSFLDLFTDIALGFLFRLFTLIGIRFRIVLSSSIRFLFLFISLGTVPRAAAALRVESNRLGHALLKRSVILAARAITDLLLDDYRDDSRTVSTALLTLALTFGGRLSIVLSGGCRRISLSARRPGLALGASLLVSIDSRLDTIGQGLVILAAAGGETCWFVAKGDALGATSGVQLHFFGFALREADSADVVGVEYGDKRDGE